MLFRCFYMESKALRAGQGFPSQRLTIRAQIRLRLLELPYVCLQKTASFRFFFGKKANSLI